MAIIEGKKIALSIEEELRKTLQQQNYSPHLTVFLVGNNPACATYVAMKKKACKRVGISSSVYKLEETVTQEELMKLIAQENSCVNTHAILVQMPLPKHIDALQVLESIDPNKDVDGFHPYNMGKTLLGQKSGYRPCTAAGICALLETLAVSYREKNAVIVGRSNIVGKPLAAMLVQKSSLSPSSVTIVHSQTHNLAQITKQADLLIVAVGRPKLITKNMVKKNSIVIDVGISRGICEKQLVGDVDFARVESHASYITPVPQGVGPMTVAMLLQNTLFCYESQR